MAAKSPSFPRPLVAELGTYQAEMVVAAFTRERVEVAPLLTAVATPADGAMATFVGIVRDHDTGRAVRFLEYEAHEGMAVSHMARLVHESQRRFGVGRALIRHRLGRCEIGDVSVAIAVAAPHRAEALKACHWLIDTLKAEVPIFKKEYFADDEAWVD
jgi:molybdopterin synthase catalytic subunit